MKYLNFLENRYITYLFLTITFSLLVAIFVIAMKFPVLGYDVWWYHLPFAGLLHDVDDFREKFGMVGSMAERYKGFPKLIEWIQGLFWSLTGELGSLALPNVLSLFFYLSFCWFWLKIRTDFLLPLLLSIPLVAIHVTSAYIDLIASISVAIQFLAGFLLIQSVNQKNSKQKNRALIVFYWLAAFMAGNSKFPSTISSLCVGIIFIGVIVYYFIYHRNNFSSNYYRRSLGIFLAGLLLSSLTLLNNTFTFGNPFYPIQIAGLPGIEESTDDNSSLKYTNFMGPLKSPVEWTLSITELDWKIRGVITDYNELSTSGDNARWGGRGRTGGCWGSYMVFNFFLLIYFLYKFRSRRKEYFFHQLSFLFLILTILTAFLPDSLKMRFYLYVPILLLTINAYALSHIQFNKTHNLLVLTAWVILGISWLTNPGIIFNEWSMKPTLPGLSSYSTPLNSNFTNPQVVKRIEKSLKDGLSEICLPTEGEGAVDEKASAYALMYGKKGFKIIQGDPECPSNF